ncbi:hypothetical protein EGW08_004755 [Elysia chlorotica]|uniref:Sodium channel modifier 1 n=1 Tax=Elysia chlorotica TaxID=188477 RepID=A0A433U0Y1_ELYCH|nr:hypothetical protein EGW08_004755 [Elysia chlorotica]
MSFKRDGDDSSLLAKLRKRRIDELLGENVPKDQAKLLSNGRFTCTVCNSVPIFDTVNMLVVHRQGKKHLANLQIYESKQRELKQLIAKRNHHQFLENGTTSQAGILSSPSGILRSTPYDSRVKKARVRPTERRERIHLQVNDFLQDDQRRDPEPFSTHDSLDSDRLTSDVSAHSKHSISSWEDIASQQLSGPVMHDHQLKQVFAKTRNRTEIALSPYQRKKGSNMVRTSSSNNRDTVELNQVSHSKLQASYVSSSQPNHPLLSSSNSTTKDNSGKISNLNTSCSVQQPQLQASVQSSQSGNRGSESSLRLQKLKQLQGSGWKKDWDGKWIKDEDAEFDSDEEPPDVF